MNKPAIEQRPLYGIGTVARLTGIKPDTLRVWERRYGLGASRKTETGRRQYTQSDLEHLQIIARLIDRGARIGEVAGANRKTLDMLLRRDATNDQLSGASGKPHTVFVGPALCDWLDAHQGCVARVEATLMRSVLAEVQAKSLAAIEQADALVLEISALSPSQEALADRVASTLGAGRVIVYYRFGNGRRVGALQARGYTVLPFPPDPVRLACELARCETERATTQGETSLGELVDIHPRKYSEADLSAAAALKGALDCECPPHIVSLIRSLAEFEQYSANCSVENWREAAVHACIYAYTGQARWLMERALDALLDGHDQDQDVP